MMNTEDLIEHLKLYCTPRCQPYSVVCNAVYRDIAAIANDIAKFIGIDVKDE